MNARKPLFMTALAVLISSASAFLAGCGGLSESIEEDLSSSYSFFDVNPESSGEAQRKDISYRIGTTLTAAELPSTSDSPFTTMRTGYRIDGWKFAGDEANMPDTIAILEDGTVSSVTVTPKPEKFYVSNWSPITYFVVFDANGGSGGMERQSLEYDSESPLAENAFTRNGYEFKSWNTVADGSGTSFDDGASVLNMAETDGATITLYAIWHKTKITISFDANGGEGTLTPLQDITVGTQLPANPLTKTGHTFSFWSATKADGTALSYSDGETLTEENWPNEDITLVAQWEPNTYILTLESNDGTSQSEQQEFTFGTEQQIIECPFAKTGYHFSGWNTQADGSGTSYRGDEAISLSEDTTVYAQWTMQTLRLSFNADGGSGTMADQTIPFDSLPFTLPQNGFSNAGFNFMGWSLAPSAQSAQFQDGAEITEASWNEFSYAEDTTNVLYAVWSRRIQFSMQPDQEKIAVTYSSTGVTFTSAEAHSSYSWKISGGSIIGSGSSITLLYDDYDDGVRRTLTLIMEDDVEPPELPVTVSSFSFVVN